jgi:endonuclease/exonuclease/phosphatase family metal-dependent hydrolase
MDVRILTYNVHGLPWNRVPMVAILAWALRCTRADILCFQEVFQRSALNDLCLVANTYGYDVIVPPECVTPSCFANPSGLCTLIKRSIAVTHWSFTPFSCAGGLEHFVKKGMLSVSCRKDDVAFTLVNTHFQSDGTEFPCVRIRHQHIRDLQEAQLERMIANSECPIVAGDFNQSLFSHFVHADPGFHVTFPETGEHLDHVLFHRSSLHRIVSSAISYFDDVQMSDHIPVLVSLRIRKELNAVSKKRSDFQ